MYIHWQWNDNDIKLIQSHAAVLSILLYTAVISLLMWLWTSSCYSIANYYLAFSCLQSHHFPKADHECVSVHDSVKMINNFISAGLSSSSIHEKQEVLAIGLSVSRIIIASGDWILNLVNWDIATGTKQQCQLESVFNN